MNYPRIAKFFLLVTLVMSVFASVNSYSQDLSQARELCDNLTQSNRAMAKSSGYDIDAICGEVDVSPPKQKVMPVTSRERRDTISTPNSLKKRQNISGPDGENLESASSLPLGDEYLGVDVTLDALKPFGYDLFANAPSTFSPSESMSVSNKYILGPGDSLDIMLFGKVNRTVSVEINREGFVDFPELGPLALAGLTYGEVKAMLKARIPAQIVGTQASVSMGTLRSIQVFVLGEAFQPGAYRVSSLSTITNALISSGGVSDIGSLRKIQLKRQGKLVTTLDLYALMLNGDISNDLQVQDSDVIFIPAVGGRVSIDGEVLRPAIYELIGDETAQNLVDLAGGFISKAFSKISKIDRVDSGFMTVFDVDLSHQKGRDFILQPGDHLTIDAVAEIKRDIVTTSGAVLHGGDYSWSEGLKISDIISTREELSLDADISIALLVRELGEGIDIEILKFSPTQIFEDKDSKDNLKLQSRDRIEFLSLYLNRSMQLKPYVDMLRLQAGQSRKPEIVTSGGEVRFPGEYPIFKNMTAIDLALISGGLTESAYPKFAEISRVEIGSDAQVSSKIIRTSLDIDDSALLVSSDFIEYRSIPNYKSRPSINLYGEFKFPGKYHFGVGETLTSVIQRAGGFTEEAFINGSIFTRQSLKDREELEMERLSESLKDELALNIVQQSEGDSDKTVVDIEAQKTALASLSSMDAVGRLVIPLNEIMAFSVSDLVLQEGDSLLIPKFNQEVTILGEVQRPTSYLFDLKLSQSDYILKSGGLTRAADSKGIYVVRANGEIVMNTNRWLKFGGTENDIQPGDSIIVPLDTNDNGVEGVALLAEVSQIIYQLSLGAAALSSFNIN